ncbi:hypothetical protein GWG65_19945 [Bradyrhizobium sp. CSA207]|uniref:hypothetical protein n=1 Tax=Bradyrhizobium sp. CSA207 TaxID=2698826 RepID=UPI0023B18B27|nr:hypothetical protein [Bradyrhizobium sp. CSA207]MDE5443676.1 hypothetical protein [Bradyrhizobium sp. CSA207]
MSYSNPPDPRLTRILYVAFGVTIAASLLTYFDALSQYATSDQEVTALRLTNFLNDPRSASPSQGSMISNIFVAGPAKLLAGLLGWIWHIDDLIVWNIHYTKILPFAVFQVTASLAFIVYLAHSATILARPHTANRTIALLFAVMVIMNYPMLKGLVKVLKYDALSTLFSAITVLCYLRYRTTRSSSSETFPVASIGFFAALAYLEKDSTFSNSVLILLIEATLLPFSSADGRTALLRLARFLGIVIATFLVTSFVGSPIFWRHPLQVLTLFSSVDQYLVNLPTGLTVLSAVILGSFYIFIPTIRPLWPARVSLPVFQRTLLLFSAAAIVVFVVATVMFQENILYDPTIAGNDLRPEDLQARSIYVSKPIALSSITTLDQSAWITHAKVLFSMIRVLFYTLPEITIFMIVTAVPLFLLLSRNNENLFKSHAATLLLLLAIPAATLLAYGVGDVPFDPKYLVLIGLLLTIYGMFPALLALTRSPGPLATTAYLAVTCAVLWTALGAAPTYLRYKNILRDRVLENASPLDMNHYIWWTWAGWGETTYAISRHIEATAKRPMTIAFDYRRPFYTTAGLAWIRIDFETCQSLAELKTILNGPEVRDADVLVVSKNMSNRRWCLNQILRRMRDQAVYVDRQQGFEYGWLFNYSDVKRTFGEEE